MGQGLKGKEIHQLWTVCTMDANGTATAGGVDEGATAGGVGEEATVDGGGGQNIEAKRRKGLDQFLPVVSLPTPPAPIVVTVFTKLND